LAAAAHRVETVQLGQQSGIQDQIAAAFGGVNHVVMTRYPDAVVTPVRLSSATRAALGQQLATVYLGKPHSSSAEHQSVIDAMERGDRLDSLEPIRQSARDAVVALEAGDLRAYGRALCLHHEAQRALHPGLVSADADIVTAVAKEHHAFGWKVNGAGGNGGTVTVLLGTDAAPFRAAVKQAGFTVLDLKPAAIGVVAR
jgi:D-glycero-alpha-D-manno-heptose-7-phosphate kinase